MRPLDELRYVEEADVLKAGIKAGRLVRRETAVLFEYDPDYAETGGAPVATTLPVDGPPIVTHAPGALPPFFSGLLPEGRRLTGLRAAVKTSADDEVSLLLAVGGDTVGDVQVVPAGEGPPDLEAQVSAEGWEEVRFLDLLAESMGSDGSVDRAAIPGVQDKISARMINIPLARDNTPFILKLDPPEFPHLVANEAFFLNAARQSGLETAET